MKFLSIFGMIIICLTGCMNDNIRHNKSNTFSLSESAAQYPESRYLIAKGFGDSKTSAQFRAKAELANIFESKINTYLKLESRAIKDSIKGASTSEKIDAIINIYSHISLKGVQVKDLESDKGQYAAIAILDKFQAKDNWLNELHLFDEKINTEYRSIQQQQSKLLWLHPVKRIWHHWLERTSIVSRLSVIGFKAPPQTLDVKVILALIATIKNNMQFYINIAETDGKYLAQEIATSLNNEGYIICDNSKKANVLITGSLSVAPLEMVNEEWKFCRASVSLQIIDCATNNQVFNISENVRKGHLTTQSAAHKSIKELSAIVQKRILDIFDPFQTGELGVFAPIIGHTDNIGSDIYNQKLSESRVRAVKQYFVQQGFHPKRLSIKGMGEAKPLTSNLTDEGRALNRRVEFTRRIGFY